MIYTKTLLSGVYVIAPELREDKRGYFFRVFSKDELEKIGIAYNIVQINRSLTVKKGTIRGLHYQKSPLGEDKIIQCIRGSIFDVAIDLRHKSKTYGRWVGEELSEKNKRMLLVPKGFAHGFQALEKNSIVEYFVTEYYSSDHESGVRWNDPRFAVEWPVKRATVSDKDSKWPLFNK